MAGSLTIDDVAPGIRALTLSNPGRKNAIDPTMLDALHRALDSKPGAVRAWLVRSDDASVFSAGYDLSALNGFPEGTPLPDERLGVVLDALMRVDAPTVALVRGGAFGAGCELATACDFRVGELTTRFSMPPARLGVVYALKGLARVKRLVGEQQARRMFLLGETVDAATARACGLLDVLSDEPEAAALELCRSLAANAPLAVQGMKRGFALLDEASPEALAAYDVMRRTSFNSRDAQEGRSALLEKRAPHFEGR